MHSRTLALINLQLLFVSTLFAWWDLAALSGGWMLYWLAGWIVEELKPPKVEMVAGELVVGDPCPAAKERPEVL